MLRQVSVSVRGAVAARACSLHRLPCLDLDTRPDPLSCELLRLVPARLQLDALRGASRMLFTRRERWARQRLLKRCRRPLLHAAAASISDGAAPKPASDVFSIELAVRDYELDQFGVVNNAVYANYAEHGAALSAEAMTPNNLRHCILC